LYFFFFLTEISNSHSDPKVIIRTQINYIPEDVKVILSTTAEIRCGVRHDPSIHYTLTWYFNGKPITNSLSGRVQVLSDGTLKIEQARNTDVGVYNCSVTSPLGNDWRTARLDLIELPHAPSDVKAVLNVKGGFVNVSWSPNFDGNSPIVRYAVYNRVVPTNPGVESDSADDVITFSDVIQGWKEVVANVSATQNFVLVTNLRPAKTYQFKVSAVNSVGEGHSSAPSNPPVTLPAQPPSAPPFGVVGAARSSTSIMIQWQPPPSDAHNGQLLGYIIKYKLARYSETPWYSRNVTNPAQLSYHLDDLIVWQNYEIQIGAYNEMGVGSFSSSICIRTKEGKPAASPNKVTAFAASSTSIAVTWLPPDPQLINGINQGYKVRAHIDNETLAKEVIVDPHPFNDRLHTTTLTDLDPFTTYLITVLCFTNAGDGPSSFPPISITTKEDTPDKVENFRFWNIFDKTVNVGWNRPARMKGELTGYTLKYYIDDAPRDQWTISNYTADTYEAVINDLKPVTSYKFEINAWSKVGAGPVTTAVIKTSIPPVLPLPPSRLAISNIGAFSVVLQFTPGFNGNATISKWVVEGQLFRLRNASWLSIFESTNNTHTNAIVVKNLRPYTEYRLRLIPFNIVGRSIEASAPSPSFQTLQAPPAHPPLNVTLRSLNSTSIRVRWTPLPPESWYGQPRGYNITWFEITDEENGVNGSLKWHVSGDYHSHSFSIRQLEEFTNYAVQVYSLNDVGTSNASRLVTQRTSEATPSAGPNHVKVTATSSTTVLVEWSGIPKKHANGMIRGFKIKYVSSRHDAVVKFKKIEGNETRTATLTELKKYTLYRISVCAYTHLGDGAYSSSFTVQTKEDVPGMPSNITFPDVTLNSARILWDVPDEPNGEILAYRVTYRMDLNESASHGNYQELKSTDRTFKAVGLQAYTDYSFSVTAKTKEGWGQPANAVVYTTNSRELPGPPSQPMISASQISSKQVTFKWKPGADGYAPLRYYTVQLSSQGGPWTSIDQRIDPSLSTYTATGLKPFTMYQFRIRATNDIGHSSWSPESPITRTLPAPPDHAVTGVSILPYSPTAVSVKWIPIKEWNGDEHGAGYRIQYCLLSQPVSSNHCPSTTVQGPTVTGVSIENLEKDHQYEIKVIPFNSQGEGPSSNKMIVYVGEAVPSGEPLNVKAIDLSSTEVNVTWSPPANDKQNGQILGYKIFYWPESKSNSDNSNLTEIPENKEIMELVPDTRLSFVVLDLEMFTSYFIQVSAFNPAGDGPRSLPVKVKTKEDIPGIVGPLNFTDITMTNLRVSWDPPIKSNGILTGYYVVYETSLTQGDFSKQVKQSVSENYLLVKGLKEKITYTFKVKAKTSVGMGPERVGTVITGPQEGSPSSVHHFNVYQTLTAVKLRWKNSMVTSRCDGPVLGYLIEGKLLSGESKEWHPIVNLRNGLEESYDLSFNHLAPSSRYTFRIMTVNKCGVSEPTFPDKSEPNSISYVITTPSHLELKAKLPFYFENWFVTTVAFTMIIIIILFVAGLCVYTTTYKYKKEAKKTESQDGLSDNEFGIEDNLHNPYASGFELRQNTLSSTTRRSNPALNNCSMAAAKCPPRPAPGSFYSDDDDVDDDIDEDVKDPNLYGSSGDSVTEKPSELSSSGPDSESDHEEVNHFVNHYANVNDTLRKNQPSWKKGAHSYIVRSSEPVNMPSRPPPPVPGSAPPPPSYQSAVAVTANKESKLDSPSVNLNSGLIIVNNMAGSRAPLPGFSSFV